uniref:gp53-like domain-containing protein n=1 Tax=Cronobacter malonaticus TaxID=413503 RepID=UPI003F799B5C
MIIQWGLASGASSYTVTFPVSFPGGLWLCWQSLIPLRRPVLPRLGWLTVLIWANRNAISSLGKLVRGND